MPRTKKTTDVEVKPKKTKKLVEQKWPKVIEGSHSIRIEHENGRIEYTVDWAKLEADVKKALRDYENSKII